VSFTQIDGVEPTNNRAERGLRGAVIYRKLSLGKQSERGEQTIERLLLSLPNLPPPTTLALRLQNVVLQANEPLRVAETDLPRWTGVGSSLFAMA
jgi:hypothetical protein